MSVCSVLDRLEAHAASPDDERDFVDLYEKFLHELACEQLSIDACTRQRNFLSQCQRRYLAIKESLANEELSGFVQGSTSSIMEALGEGFAADAYKRVSDLEKLVKLPVCRHIVMVGSGAFPVTLFWLYDHLPDAFFVGLDKDQRCLDKARSLVAKMKIESMHFELVDGCNYNFDGADLVYIANHVSPKKSVLARVSQAFTVTQIVVREPTLKGELFTEAVSHELPSGLAIAGRGAEHPTFLSYDLLLHRN